MNNTDTIKFMNFAFNLPLQWISIVWSSNKESNENLITKWEHLSASNKLSGTLNFFKFFMTLDREEKNHLLSWINSHYLNN